MSLLTALLILRHEDTYASKVSAATAELSAWLHDRAGRTLVEPVSGQPVRASPQDREDVAQTALVLILRIMRRHNSDILDQAVGLGRVNSRRGGATASFVEFGLLDPEVVLGPEPPERAGALEEANAALARYLETTLARLVLSGARRGHREVLTESPPDLAAESAEPRDHQHLEGVREQLRRAFERGYCNVREQDRAQWSLRFHDLQRVSREELSISALALREMGSRDPLFAELDERALGEVEQLVVATGPRTRLGELVLSAVRERDVSALEALEDQLGVATDPAWRAVAERIHALVLRWQESLRSPEGRRARATVDTWNRRIRRHVDDGIAELEALSPADPQHMTSVAALQTRRAADVLLRRCQNRGPRRVLDGDS